MIILFMVFIYHHGFQTGEKVHGKPSKPGGWNSRTMSDETNKHLIQKHGFIRWWKTMCRAEMPSEIENQRLKNSIEKIFSKCSHM